MDEPSSDRLLESTHSFPCVFPIKAIGSAAEHFESRVLQVVREELAGPSELDCSVRTTPGGRHVALTLDITVQTADQVRAIYRRIRALDGLKLLL